LGTDGDAAAEVGGVEAADEAAAAAEVAAAADGETRADVVADGASFGLGVAPPSLGLSSAGAAVAVVAAAAEVAMLGTLAADADDIAAGECGCRLAGAVSCRGMPPPTRRSTGLRGDARQCTQRRKMAEQHQMNKNK
jgi:hypothetical protein